MRPRQRVAACALQAAHWLRASLNKPCNDCCRQLTKVTAACLQVNQGGLELQVCGAHGVHDRGNADKLGLGC